MEISIKTVEEITSYYSKNLKHSLLKLEMQRQETKQKVNKLVAIEAFVLLIIYAIWMPQIDLGALFLFLFLLVAAYAFTKRLLSKSYVKNFKQNIITPLIHFIDKNLVYREEKFVNKESFIASKIETDKIVDYRGNDFVYGNIDGVNIKFSELSINTQEKNDDDSKLSFWGLFIVAEFPKHFKAHTIIHSSKGRVLQALKPDSNYKTIKMDSPAFNEKFVVYSTDEIEARYILSPALMEKIELYNDKMRYATSLSFVDGNIYISNQCGDILEPSLQKSLLDFQIARSYALSLHFAISVVETLRLDLKLWSKN